MEQGYIVHEIISKRLYISRKDVYSKEDLEGKAVVVDLSGEAKIPQTCKSECIYLRWDMDADVDEHAFEGLVRFCACMMRAPKTAVLIVGHQDTVDVVAACAMREYLGCNGKIAVGILRESRSNALSKQTLLETVMNYKVS